jgi:hypothetical protein
MIRRTINTVEALVRLLAEPTRKNLNAILSLAEDLAERIGQEGVVHLKDELRALAAGDRDLWARTLAVLIRDGHSNLYGRLKPLSPFAADVVVIRGAGVIRGDIDDLLALIGQPATVWRHRCKDAEFIALSFKDGE